MSELGPTPANGLPNTTPLLRNFPRSPEKLNVGLHAEGVPCGVSCRITLELLIQDRQIIPVNVGDHDAVY